MRPGSLAILGIAAYSTFLVATVPARWVAERFVPNPGRIALTEVEGTVWSGRAKAALGTLSGVFAVERLEWRFLPSRLLQARAAYDVSMRGAGFEARGELARTFAGWSARSVAATADAALATAAVQWLGAWRPEGKVNLAADALDFDAREARGTARLDWTNAATSLSQVKPLGTYRAEVIAEGPAAQVKVSTLAGALRVSGQGRLDFPARFAFTGEARAEAAQAAALEPLLNLMGAPRPDGSRAIDWRTR